MKSIYSKTLNIGSKDKEMKNSNCNHSPENEHLPKLEKTIKCFTPSPISTRIQESSSVTSFPYDNYKKQTTMLQANKSVKPISVNRKGKSLDLSQNDSFSLNKSKISNSIYKKAPKNIISLRSNTPNISMTSMTKMNASETNSNVQTSFTVKKKTLVKSTYLFTHQHKANNIFNKTMPSGRNKFKNGNNTTQKKITNKKHSSPTFSQSFNYSQIMPHKKILEINTSMPKTDKREKSETSSDSSLVTKEMTPKIQKFEQIKKNQFKIKKKIKCMHDLSKTGLSGEEKKVNQDNFFIFKNFSNYWDYIYIGVW